MPAKKPAAVTRDVEANTKIKAPRVNHPGVRTQGNRIYDSQNGKTCHQCRQKTMDVAATCASKGKCRLHWCFKCLRNRYGEAVAEVSLLTQWDCPKCRGLCNCSNCQRRKGLTPTGCLAPSAKQLGFASVGDMLKHNPGASAMAISDTMQAPEPPATPPKSEGPSPRRPKKGLKMKSISSLRARLSIAQQSITVGTTHADRQAGTGTAATTAVSSIASDSNAVSKTGRAAARPGLQPMPRMGLQRVTSQRAHLRDAAGNEVWPETVLPQKPGAKSNKVPAVTSYKSESTQLTADCSGLGQITAFKRRSSDAPKDQRRQKEPRRSGPAVEKAEVIHDSQLPAPLHPMPGASPIGTTSLDGSWQQLPDGCCGGDLAEVLEFLTIFEEPLQLRPINFAAVLAQLLSDGQGLPPCNGVRSRGQKDAQQPLPTVIVALLNLVAKAYEETVIRKGAPWEANIAPYLLPPYCRQVQGDISTNTSRGAEDSAESSYDSSLGSRTGLRSAGSCTDANAPSSFPNSSVSVAALESKPFWSQPPAAKLRALLNLCRDAMNCWQLREYIDQKQEAAVATAKEARQLAAATRKRLQGDLQQARNKELALLLLKCTSSLTPEQQRHMIAVATQKASAAAGIKAAAVSDCPTAAAVRVERLGEARCGTLFWSLASSAALTGGQRQLLVEQPSNGSVRKWGVQSDRDAVVRSLDARGVLEGPLLKSIIASVPLD